MLSANTLVQLGAWGLKTPETIAVDQAEALETLVPESWNGPLYLRGVGMREEKVTRVGQRDEIVRFAIGNGAGVSSWIVQELIGFDYGGACAVLGHEDLYVEAVTGMPVGLLRHGELGGGLRVTKSSGIFHVGRQQRSWLIRGGQLAVSDCVPEDPTPLRFVLGVACQQVKDAQADGLLEWGVVGSELYWLDWKCFARTSELRSLIDTGSLRPDTVLANERRVSELPSLRESGATDVADLIFDRGARLSHLVTYAIARGEIAIRFEGW